MTPENRDKLLKLADTLDKLPPFPGSPQPKAASKLVVWVPWDTDGINRHDIAEIDILGNPVHPRNLEARVRELVKGEFIMTVSPIVLAIIEKLVRKGEIKGEVTIQVSTAERSQTIPVCTDGSLLYPLPYEDMADSPWDACFTHRYET